MLIGRVVVVLAGLLVPAAALGASGLATGARADAASTANACRAPDRALPAAELRVPQELGPCEVGRRVTAFAGRVAAKVPPEKRHVCTVRVRGRYGYHLCVETENRRLYALAFRRPVPAVCRGGGAIRASALMAPVAKQTCNLVGRLVRYHGVGVHVPSSGTTCGAADDTGGEVELCVTADRLAFYAQHESRTAARGRASAKRQRRPSHGAG